MYFAITGDGYFLQLKPWTNVFLFFLPAELPTFLLALGTVVPKLRSDLLFGITFFLTRILFHFYLVAYAYISGAAAMIIGFGCLTGLMHLKWFHAWFTKYGKHYMFGKKAKKI